MVIIVLVLLLLIIGVGMTTQQGVRNRAFNLATIRRLYFYLVALVSFIAALVGLDNLLRNLSDAWLGSTGISQVNSNEYLRNNIASSASVLLVATPIFLLHWGFVQRRQNESGEPQSALRKFFLYAASGVALGYAVAKSNADLLTFLDTWLLNARTGGTIDALYSYWMLGEVKKTQPPRWSVMRDVLGWGD